MWNWQINYSIKHSLTINNFNVEIIYFSKLINLHIDQNFGWSVCFCVIGAKVKDLST